MSAKIISVIVPVYNVEKYLHRCIDSILAQTFTDFELILIDDGSTDNSGKICENYKEKDSRILVIHQENNGQASARNNALDIAEGEFIAFVDSDDYIHPMMFETMMDILEKTSADIVLCNYIEGYQNNFIWEYPKKLFHICDGKNFLRTCILNNGTGCWVLWDKIYRRECFEGVRLPEGRKYEDNATVYKVLYNAKQIAISDNILYYYFTNANSTTKSGFSANIADWLLALEEMIEFFLNASENKVCDCLTKRYLDEGVYYFNKIKESFPQSSKLNHIKRVLKRLLQRNQKRLNISIRNNPPLYSVVYPTYSKFYWNTLAVFQKIKTIKKK